MRQPFPCPRPGLARVFSSSCNCFSRIPRAMHPSPDQVHAQCNQIVAVSNGGRIAGCFSNSAACRTKIRNDPAYHASRGSRAVQFEFQRKCFAHQQSPQVALRICFTSLNCMCCRSIRRFPRFAFSESATAANPFRQRRANFFVAIEMDFACGWIALAWLAWRCHAKSPSTAAMDARLPRRSRFAAKAGPPPFSPA